MRDQVCHDTSPRRLPAHRILALAAAICCAGLSAPAMARIAIFDPDGSTGTIPTGINAEGVIVGYYNAGGNAYHSFLRVPDGTITKLDDVSGGAGATFAMSINQSGDITGYFASAYLAASHGFLRKASGKIVTFDPPGSADTFSATINSAGTIAGSYIDQRGESHGFVRPTGGKISVFDPPGSIGTDVVSMNDSGVIAGMFETSQGFPGFVRAADGSFATIDPAGSLFTIVSGIDDSGDVVGYYDAYDDHGFLRTPDGTITTIDPPGSIGTELYGINDKGVITGEYAIEINTGHGFVRAADGKYATFDPKGADYTTPLAIDRHGVIEGKFIESNMYHGFVRSR
jgi:hypothetical protein